MDTAGTLDVGPWRAATVRGVLHVWESPHTDTCVHIGHRVARPVFVTNGARVGHRTKPLAVCWHSAHVGECQHTRRYDRLQRARGKAE